MSNLATQWNYPSKNIPNVLEIGSRPNSRHILGKWTRRTLDNDPAKGVALTMGFSAATTDGPFLSSVSEQLQKILDLPKNWDNEGSNPFTLDQVSRVDSLFIALEQVASKLAQTIESPLVSASDESIDISWSNEEAIVLINVPNDPQENCQIYGTSKTKSDLDFIASPAIDALPALILLALTPLGFAK